jgi:hypothetical protein
MAELGPARDVWHQVEVDKPHQIQHSMEFDSVRRQLAVFGDASNSNRVWVYAPGTFPGDASAWEECSPGDDPCPPDQHFPVAFDEHSGVFLLVADNNSAAPKGQKAKSDRATSSSTFVYDPERNEYCNLPDADMPALGMNYMMRAPAVFLAEPARNTISMADSSCVVIRKLTLNGRGVAVDAVKCEGRAAVADLITLQNLRIDGHGATRGRW